MSQLEWYRNFVSVYRAGSVSGAAKARNLTQPAVSQQLAALEGAVGAALFVRTPKGVQPTPRGKALYSEVFDALDRLDRVSRGLRGRAALGLTRVRLGASPEYFQAFALERLGGLICGEGTSSGGAFELTAHFGDDRELLGLLESGVLDVAVTSLKPTSGLLQHRVLAPKHFVLVGSPDLEPPSPALAAAELAAWLGARPWVGYSQELPATRRFWQQHLNTRFGARQRLVVPDLRAVLRAVELGYGVSILPELMCQGALQAGRVQELWPLRELIQGEQWVLSFREVDSDRPELIRIADALSLPGT
ncbi:LysR family transcriptional regulator [Deinococcus altitudinis]|uniref:LysR family transcriptional regulator n=1 Tax=Deinococcus altitudinis TaxID=468914 RepID=UPI003891F75C